MGDVNLAAHVDCKVGHSAADAGFFIGLGLGILAGIAIVATGGLAAPVIALACGVATASAGAGEVIGSQADVEDSGHIARGSPTTFYGPRTRAAARMNDRTACFSPGMATMESLASPAVPIFGALSGIRQGWRQLRVFAMNLRGEEILPTDGAPGAHPGSKIADGSRTVSIDRMPAARKEDGVHPCAGKISSGIESIKIGGPRGAMAGTEDRDEVDSSMRGVAFVIDVVGNVAGGPADFALWFAQQFGGAIDERIPAIIDLFKFSRGVARAHSRDISFDPMTGIQRLERGHEYYERATGAPRQLENARTIFGPARAPDTVFDPATGRWVPGRPPNRLF